MAEPIFARTKPMLFINAARTKNAMKYGKIDLRDTLFSLTIVFDLALLLSALDFFLFAIYENGITVGIIESILVNSAIVV